MLWRLALSATAVLTLVLGAPSVCNADDLSDLVRSYERAKGGVGGAPDARAKKAKEKVAPIAAKIAALGSDEAMNFLAREMDSALPEVGGVCGAALVGMKNDRAIGLALRGFSKKHARVATGVLEGLAKSKRKLASHEDDILEAAGSTRDPAVKRAWPPVLAKLDTLGSARWMLLAVRDEKARNRQDAARQMQSAANKALAGTKNDEVKRWLAGPAFKEVGRDVARLSLLLDVVGLLKLEDARGEVEEQFSSGSSEVASAALIAIEKLGAEKSSDAIVAALQKRRGRQHLGFRIRALDALASTGKPEAARRIAELARGKDPEMRAVAMGSLGRMGQSELAQKALVRGLGDKDANVRACALRAIRGLKSKSIIGPLIEFMATEEQNRFKVDALKILMRLTGQNFGLVAEDWQKWWRFEAKDFEFPTGDEEAATKVTVHGLDYFGIEISSNRLSFVVDVSSSMTQSVNVVSKGGKKSKARKIDVLKKELERVVTKLSRAARMNILKFDANYSYWQKQLQPLAGSGRAKAVKYVRSISTGSGTNVYDSLEHALKDKNVNTIFLLTDGQPTRGKYRDTPSILREIGIQNRTRAVTIHCIAFGEESDLLKKLASQNGGDYRFVNRYDAGE